MFNKYLIHKFLQFVPQFFYFDKLNGMCETSNGDWTFSCCLIPSEQYFSYIPNKKTWHLDRHVTGSLDRQNEKEDIMDRIGKQCFTACHEQPWLLLRIRSCWKLFYVHKGALSINLRHFWKASLFIWCVLLDERVPPGLSEGFYPAAP